MKYILEHYEPHKKVVYVGENETLKALDTIEFESTGNGTKIYYKAEFQFNGFWNNIESIMSPIMEQVGKKAFRGMELALREFATPEFSFWTKLSDNLIIPGALNFSKLGYKWSKETKKPIINYIEDKTFLITGGSSGLELASAMSLAKYGSKIILVSKSSEKLEKAKLSIIKETGNQNIHTRTADLSSLEEVHKLADALKQSEEKIDVLINNAGYLFNERKTTREGNEMSLSLLLLSPFLLILRKV